MGLFSISCKKATYLSSKKEAGKANWIEKIQLRSHLVICSLCRFFEEQSAIIADHAKHNECTETLPEKTKIKIKEALEAETT